MLMFAKPSTSAADDGDKSSNIARNMITRYGDE